MRPEIEIQGKRIGNGHPLFIMAECGVSCNYDMAVTKELIDAVRASGADAIKLIFWFPDEIISDRTVMYTYQAGDGTTHSENMYEMLDRLRFTLEQWQEVKCYADERGVILFSTVNSPTGIEWAEKLQLPAYKLSSWDYNHLPLWRRIARIGKPMLIDTGPVYTVDVAKVLRLMQEEHNDQCVLVHTVHTEKWSEINMRTIPFMASAFNTPVGYSSRDQRSETDVMAVSLGASVIEKRLTMSRKLPGHHHVLSMEPGEFEAYVRTIRDVQAALGQHDLVPSPPDLLERRKWFRHLVADRNLKTGTVLAAEMLEGKRGEAGVSPEFMDLFVGRPLKRDLARNESMSWDDV